MIIFNGQEFKSPYTKTENKVIEINTVDGITMTDMMQLLLNEEPLDERFSVNVHSYSKGPVLFQNNTDPSEQRYYNRLFSEDDIQDLYQVDEIRPIEFEMFEQYLFGQNSGVYEFENADITPQELLYELKMAYGLPPSVLDEDLTLEEMEHYKTAAEALLIPNIALSAENPCPTIQDLDHYNELNTYEKRLIRQRTVHPYKAFQYARMLKESINAGYVLNVDDYHQIMESPNEPLQTLMENYEQARTLSPELQNRIQESFRRTQPRAPRVANEYIKGFMRRYGNEEPTDEVLDSWTSQFKLNSVSKVANKRSINLLAAQDLQYDQMSTQLIDALAVHFNRQKMFDLERKGFFTWLNENKTLGVNQIIEAMEHVDHIPHYEGSVRQLLSAAKNEKGVRDCQRFTHDDPTFDFSKNELAIKGRHTEAKQGNIVMRMLPPTDYTNFTVGYDTCCCQHYGNAGASCTKLACSDPFAGIVVVEEKGNVMAQGFVWVDAATDTLVFDNIEFAGDNRRDKELSLRYLNIIQEWCHAMPYKNIHIGTGYNASMAGWGGLAEYQATMPHTLKQDYIYSDYHVGDGYGSKARSVKKDGVMELMRTNHDDIEITTRPDEPTRWDELATPALAFMLNDCSKTIEERIQVARDFLNNPTPEVQMQVVSAHPQAIIGLENPCEEAQLYIFQHHPNLVSLIKTPVPAIRIEQIKKNPQLLLEEEQPTDDMYLAAFRSNPAMIKQLPVPLHLTSTLNHEIVEAQPQLLSYIPMEQRTNELNLLAISLDAKIIQNFRPEEITREMAIAAIHQDPDIALSIQNPSFELKKVMVETNPITILSIDNTPPMDIDMDEHNNQVHELWSIAVHNQGNLIRHCGKTFPDLRIPAIQNNPFAIRCLPDPTEEEIQLAVDAHPRAYLYIRGTEASEYAFNLALQKYGAKDLPKRTYYDIANQTKQPEPEQMEIETEA